MISTRAGAAILLAGIALAGAQTACRKHPAGDTATGQELEVIIRARKDAVATGDREAWGRNIGEDCLFTSSSVHIQTKAQVANAILPPSPGYRVTVELEDFQVRDTNDAAVATYLETDRLLLKGQTIVSHYRYSDTYVYRDGRWQLILADETPLPLDRKVVRVNPRLYDAYAGRYEFAPAVIFKISREGNKLMIEGGMGETTKGELLPENETTFFESGESWQYVFVKDKAGRVSQMIFRNHGQDHRMPRLK